ncbi:MAG: hypothetical protein Q4C76_05835 [Bacillota bacterium]|nr:hypothetical protein [Bacillota bacterium]
MAKHSNLLLALLTVVTCLSVCTALWALSNQEPDPVLPPDELPAAEENAVPTGDDNGEKMDQPEGGGAVNLTYSDQVTISLSEGTAQLSFSNPSRSNQSMVLEIVIQGTTVVQSGALVPGTQVETLPLLDTAKLSPGGYEGKFQVTFYDENGAQALLNTEIPISITVTE